MFVKPADGRAPRCPYTSMRIPAEGQAYPDHDPHIALFVRCGDLVEATPPAPSDKPVAPFRFPDGAEPEAAAPTDQRAEPEPEHEEGH